MEYFSIVEECYVDYKIEIMEKFSLFQSPASVSTSVYQTSSGQSSRPFVKLPDIVLPKFSGSYTEWPTFKDLFSSLIDQN